MSFEAPCLQAGVPELSVTDAWTEIAFGDVPKLRFVLVWNCAKRQLRIGPDGEGVEAGIFRMSELR
jgi:hypothetical protein